MDDNRETIVDEETGAEFAVPDEERNYSLPPEKFGHPLHTMTDSEKLDELVYQVRSIAEAIATFQTMGPADILKSFLGGKKS